mmetsp:Transcript_122695/g.381989  ORF Transcript_122695/g.381989 Transcript_122695/m.381989 type:complete len:356 (-) Transcript_122695:7-1074(-)
MASASTSRDKILMSFAAQVGAASRHAQRLLAEAADEDCRLLEFFRLANALLAHLGQLLRPQMRADQRTLHRGLPSSCQQVLPLLAQLAVAPLPARPTLTSATPSSSPAACSRGPSQSSNVNKLRFDMELTVRCFDAGGPARPAMPTIRQHARTTTTTATDATAASSCPLRIVMPPATTSLVSATTHCSQRSAWMCRSYWLRQQRLSFPSRSVMSDAAVAADLPLQSCGVVHVASGPDAARIVELNDNKRRWVSATMMKLRHDQDPQGVRLLDVYKSFRETLGGSSDEVTREIQSIIEKEFHAVKNGVECLSVSGSRPLPLCTVFLPACAGSRVLAFARCSLFRSLARQRIVLKTQ